MRIAGLIVRLDAVVRRKRFFHTAHSHLASFYMSLANVHCVRGCMGICQVMALIGDTKQVMSKGSSAPVETGLI